MKKMQQPTEEMVQMLRQTGSTNRAEAEAAMQALAQALQTPLRSALINGDLLSPIYAVENLDPGATAEFPLDFYRDSNEADHVAYSMPSEGAIPTRTVQGDTITVQTFMSASSIDWPLKYARQARWNIVVRAMEVLEGSFIRKINTDGYTTVIAAGAGRTDVSGGAPLIFDTLASPGQFTKALVSLMKTSMTRLAGGNSATQGRGRLTDLYVSPEALEDIREWDLDDIDDLTRREIFLADDSSPGPSSGPLARIYGVNIRSITELGEGQEFNKFYLQTLGESLAGGGDVELVVGLDLQENDSFVMPVKVPLQMFDDPTLHRRGLAGMYGWQEHGFAVLDSRRVILGSF